MQEWLSNSYRNIPPELGLFLSSIIAIALIWLTRRIVLLVALRNMEDASEIYRWRKTTFFVAFIVAVIILGRIWIYGVGSVSTYLGLLSAGIAIALKDPVINFVAWLFIITTRVFEVGDRIQIGKDRGDVIDQQVMQFQLMETGNWVDADQSTGRIIHVPNGTVFRETLANYSKGFHYIWEELPVLVTFESNWKKAKEILREIADEHTSAISEKAEREMKKAQRSHMITYTKFTAIVYTSVKDSGVLLTIRYLVGPRQRRGIAQLVWENILEEFAKDDELEFAYPTTRFYTSTGESANS